MLEILWIQPITARHAIGTDGMILGGSKKREAAKRSRHQDASSFTLARAARPAPGRRRHALSRRRRFLGSAVARLSSALHAPGGPACVAGPAPPLLRLVVSRVRVRLPRGLDETRARAPGRARARAPRGSRAGRPARAAAREGCSRVAVDGRPRSTASRPLRSPSRGRAGVSPRAGLPGGVSRVPGVLGGGGARAPARPVRRGSAFRGGARGAFQRRRRVRRARRVDVRVVRRRVRTRRRETKAHGFVRFGAEGRERVSFGESHTSQRHARVERPFFEKRLLSIQRRSARVRAAGTRHGARREATRKDARREKRRREKRRRRRRRVPNERRVRAVHVRVDGCAQRGGRRRDARAHELRVDSHAARRDRHGLERLLVAAVPRYGPRRRVARAATIPGGDDVSRR